jgi:hypothetical protein
MQLLKRWGYLLFMAVLAAGFAVWQRDFSLSLMVISFTVSDPLYLMLDKARQRKWLVPCGIMLALALGGFYYVAELIVFPHSASAAHLFQDACRLGLIWSAAGLAAAYWSPRNRRKTMPGNQTMP